MEGSPRTTTVVRLRRAWYVLATSAELGRQPLLRKLHGEPVVLFRGSEGVAGALQDRCPHRNVPLSQGQVVGPHLQCRYHGWEYDTGGVCRRVPGLVDVSPDSSARTVPSYATVERDGFVWVWATPGEKPEGEPFALPPLPKDATEARYTVDAPGTLHATIENALDVPHTAFLHGGLFRKDRQDRTPIRAVITRSPHHVQAEYQGEERPPGLAARLMAPGGGTVEHWDRFFLPSVAEVEYRLGEATSIVTTSFCTPLDDFETRMFAVIRLRVPWIPAALLKPLLAPIGLRIFAQDAEILATQTETIRRFGEELFVSTEIDVLGAQILRLMKRAEAGAAPDSEGQDDAYRKELVLAL